MSDHLMGRGPLTRLRGESYRYAMQLATEGLFWPLVAGLASSV